MARSSTSFTGKWLSGRTKVIRVPETLVPAVLDYARKLDARETGIRDQEARYDCCGTLGPGEPVNVASVPQRSPFRYPGGKTWLVPYIRAWLRSRPVRPRVLLEPFAGGGIVGLTAAFEGLAESVILVEKDPDVASVWHTILGGQVEWFAQRILGFDFQRDNVLEILRSNPKTQRERAFATLLRNRVQRGGIMAPGAGLVKNGENGRGLSSRWYPQTLARRIRAIAEIRHRLTFIEGDGMEWIARYGDDEGAAFFVDPPYTVAARRLYPHWQVDHRGLFEMARTIRGDVLLTYDNTIEIAKLAEEYDFETRAVAMKNTHHARMTELLIGKDLSWFTVGLVSAVSRPRTVQGTLDLRP